MTTDRKILLYMLFWSVAVLLLLSSDSPIHGPWDRNDSAAFFTASKALMNGLKPYVDFTGPYGLLLWVIYGIGYLLSPRTYYGVWVVSCLFYAGTLYNNYRTAQLLLGDTRRAVAAAMVMPFFYFQYWFHDDVRAEDFCALFMSVSLYFMVKAVWGCGGAAAQQTEKRTGKRKEKRTENQTEKRTVKQTGLVMGGCFTALVMIASSMAVMQAAMVLAVAYCFQRHERRQVMPFVKWTVAGALAVALPFVVYMLMTDTFTPFINEYLIGTTPGAQEGEGFLSTYLKEVSIALRSDVRLALLLALIVSGWFASRHLPRCSYAPLLLSLLFYGVCTRHTQYYDYNICSIFLIFLPIQFLSHSVSPLRLSALGAVAACVLGWGVYENIHEKSHLHQVCIWTENTRESTFRAFENEIQGHQPTILYLYGYDYGYGLKSGALPSGKYWSYREGWPFETEMEHVRLMLERRADYIIVNDYDRCRKRGFTSQRFRMFDYKLQCKMKLKDFRGSNLEARIYKRTDLR